MVPVRRMAESALKRIADKTAIGAGSGCVQPQPGPFADQELVELPLSHTRLNRDVSQTLVEVKNAVESTEIQQRTAIGRGNSGSVTPVLTGADRIDWHAGSVCFPHTLLNSPGGNGGEG